jgi:cell division septation protein DedD
MRRTRIPAAAGAIGALVVVILGAGTASADKCTAAKLRAIGKKERGLLACQAKVALRGSAIEPACDRKIISRFDARYERPGPCGAPASSVCEAIADDCRDQLRAALPDGDAAAPSRCAAARLKASARKVAAELGCYARAAAKDAAIDGRCLSKASRKFNLTFDKVSGCIGDGRAAMIEAILDTECVVQLVTVDRTGKMTGICPVGTVTTTSAPPASTTTTPTAPTITTTTAATTTTSVAPVTTTTQTTTTTVASTTTSTTEVTTTTTEQTTTTTIPACDVCSTGPARDPGCSPCAMLVCAATQDPACCANQWDSICVAEACTVCGAPCPGSPCAP